jgi:hypothetical protein
MAFKMKGHTLPGPNQREESPVKDFGASLATAAIIAALSAGAKAGADKGKASKAKRAKHAAEASTHLQESAEAMSQEMGTKTDITKG